MYPASPENPLSLGNIFNSSITEKYTISVSIEEPNKFSLFMMILKKKKQPTKKDELSFDEGKYVFVSTYHTVIASDIKPKNCTGYPPNW